MLLTASCPVVEVTRNSCAGHVAQTSECHGDDGRDGTTATREELVPEPRDVRAQPVGTAVLHGYHPVRRRASANGNGDGTSTAGHGALDASPADRHRRNEPAPRWFDCRHPKPLATPRPPSPSSPTADSGGDRRQNMQHHHRGHQNQQQQQQQQQYDHHHYTYRAHRPRHHHHTHHLHMWTSSCCWWLLVLYAAVVVIASFARAAHSAKDGKQ